MKDYLYDGNFEGLLTCIYLHYYEEKAAGIYAEEQYQGSLFADSVIVNTDEEKAVKVYEAIEKKISTFDLRRLYRTFLSSEPNKEMAILNYVRLGFKEGARVSALHSHPVVFAVQQCEKKVSFEAHRLTGLVRFSALAFPGRAFGSEKEILYSVVEPDHDVLELIADHFSDRLKSDPFILHDKRRGKAVFAQQGSWYMSPFNDKELPELAEGEKEYRRMWKKYFETIAIQERINPRCQKNFMPVRYWKNLTEFKGS